MGKQAGRGGCEGHVREELNFFNNAARRYNHSHFWKWMKKDGGGDKLPDRLEKHITSDIGPLAKVKDTHARPGDRGYDPGSPSPPRSASSCCHCKPRFLSDVQDDLSKY